MTKRIMGLTVLLMSFSAGGCAPTNVVNTTQIYDPVDAVQQYTQRTDQVTLSGGDAQDVNTRIQEVDPWPRYVGNKRIATSGERMAGAAERYRDVSQLPKAPKPLETVSTTSIEGAGGTSGGSSGGK